LIVTNPELAAVVDASKAIQVAKDLKVKPVGVILNRVGGFRGELMDAEIEPLLYNIPIIGRVPRDRRVQAVQKHSETMVEYHPNSRVAREFRNVAHRLAGKKETEEAGLLEALDSLRSRMGI